MTLTKMYGLVEIEKFYSSSVERHCSCQHCTVTHFWISNFI